jgi:hypothetical protein
LAYVGHGIHDVYLLTDIFSTVFEAASRRDDVEALLNVLVYLMRGDLPWQQASSDAEGAKMKRDTSITDLCRSLPTEWAAMLTKARSHEFEDKPDYDFFSQQFVKLGAKASFSGPFVWGSKVRFFSQFWTWTISNRVEY